MTMNDPFDPALYESPDQRSHLLDAYASAQVATLDLIAEHAPLDRTLDCVCELVETILPGTQALVATADEQQQLNVYHGRAFPHRLVDALSALLRDWTERAPLPLNSDARVLVDDATEPGQSVWCLPITGIGDRLLGALCVRRLWLNQPNARATLMVEHASRLAQIAIEHHHAERQIIQLLAAERRQVAADLHDDPVQAVTAVSLMLQRLAMDVPADQADLLARARTTVDRAIERMRRMLFELHPVALDEEGLAVAVEVYLEETFEPLGLVWTLDDALTGEPDAYIATLTYRLVHEALANVVAHAEASQVRVSLASDDEALTAVIVDDGHGFDPSHVPSRRPGHLGLDAVRQLAQRASGSLAVESAPGAGCTVRIRLPTAHHAGRASTR